MNTLNVEKHAAARLNDIHYAEGLILRKRKSDQINPSDLFKHISRGSRRRASSHKPKRYPLHLRLKLAKKKYTNNTTNPINRRRRRRQGKYTLLNNSLQLLPTHKWHAKRFHFDPSPWQIRTPDRYAERSERSTIKAACQQCTAHDASYMRVIELTGLASSFLHPKHGMFPTGFVFKEGFVSNVTLSNPRTGNGASSSSSSSSTCPSSTSASASTVVVDLFCRNVSNSNHTTTANVFVLVHFSALEVNMRVAVED